MRAARTSTLVTLAAASAVALHALGDGTLAGPPLRPSGWAAWAAGRDPASAAMAALRMAGVAGASYLAAVTALGAVARAVGSPRLRRRFDALTLPGLRRLLDALFGLALVTAPVATSAAPAVAVSLAAVDDDPPLLRRLPDGPGPTGEQPARPPVAPASVAAPPVGSVAAAAAPPAGTASWIVRPGDHLWSIAERVLADTWRRPPSDAEIDPYWRRLVAANRSVLADPNDPDLIYPGQVLRLPAPPGA